MAEQAYLKIKREIWMDIEDYKGHYQVSNLGKVRSLDRTNKHSENKIRMIKGRLLKIQINNKRNGYCEISLHKEGFEKRYKIHRLVAIAFIPNPNNKKEVNHIDGNKSNNCVENLEWVTSIENIKHAWDNGLSNSNHRKKKIVCLESGIIFNSVNEASIMLNCDRRSIFRQLKGEVKSVKGMTFHYHKTPQFLKELAEYREGINS